MANALNRGEKTQTEALNERIRFNPEQMDSVEKFFEASQDKRVVLIHSVRGSSKDEPEYISDFVNKSRTQGIQVYIPKIFNFQNDETNGVTICNTMRYVIENSGEVAVGYNPDSEGSKFDLGMALFNHKKLLLLNPDENFDDDIYNFLRYETDKTIQNMSDRYIHTIFSRHLIEESNAINRCNLVPLRLRYNINPKGTTYPPVLAPTNAIFMGMVYASRKPFMLSNLEDVMAQLDLEKNSNVMKSYSRVALKMHNFYHSAS